MIEMIKVNVLYPASTRLGSIAAGSMVTLGMTQPHANAVGLGVAALVGFGVDLGLAWLRKRFIQNKAVADTLESVVGPVRVNL